MTSNIPVFSHHANEHWTHFEMLRDETQLAVSRLMLANAISMTQVFRISFTNCRLSEHGQDHNRCLLSLQTQMFTTYFLTVRLQKTGSNADFCDVTQCLLPCPGCSTCSGYPDAKLHCVQENT
jgi:hypothetical protein